MKVATIEFNPCQPVLVTASDDDRWIFQQGSLAAFWELGEAIVWLRAHLGFQCEFNDLGGSCVSSATALQILTAEAGLKNDRRQLILAGHARVA